MLAGQLQKALYGALTTYSPAIAEGRVYDRVPSDRTFPYVTIGEEQTLDESNSCDDEWLVACDVHIWSRPTDGSKAEVKLLRARVSAAVRAIVSSDVDDFDVIDDIEVRSNVLRDPDGLTEHVILTFEFRLTPPVS